MTMIPSGPRPRHPCSAPSSLSSASRRRRRRCVPSGPRPRQPRRTGAGRGRGPAPVAPTPATGRRDAQSAERLLQDHPPAVREVLQREPALLNNADYLAPYPRLAAFVAAHPEIVRSPAYFLGEPHRVERRRAGHVDVARADDVDLGRRSSCWAPRSASAGSSGRRSTIAAGSACRRSRWTRTASCSIG